MACQSKEFNVEGKINPEALGMTADAGAGGGMTPTCTAPMVLNPTTNMCMAPGGGGATPPTCNAPMVLNTAMDMCVAPGGGGGGMPPTCTAPMVLNAAMNMCVAPGGGMPPTCTAPMVLNAAMNMCVAPGGGGGGTTPTCVAPMLLNTATNMCSADLDADGEMNATDVDDDGDSLIEIRTLAEFNNIRFSLDGTMYDTDEDDSAGAGTMAGGTGSNAGCNGGACNGYELQANLDFDTDSDGGTIGLDLAANAPTGIDDTRAMGDTDDMFYNAGAGFVPIGCSAMTCMNAQYFSAIFEGNGYTISNLYIHHGFGETPANVDLRGTGLFNSRNATFRNIRLRNAYVVALVNANSSNNVGALSGEARGVTASNCHASGNVYSGNVAAVATGGLFGNTAPNTGETNPQIIASSFAGNVFGRQAVGGLVGQTSAGTILASFVTGGKVVAEGAPDAEAGGLLGRGMATTAPFDRVIASYSTNLVESRMLMVNGQTAGGLVGSFANMGSEIIASYATGNVNGFDTATALPNGALVAGANPAMVGDPSPSVTINASYGFGSVVNNMGTANTLAAPGMLVLATLTLANVSTAMPNPWNHDGTGTADAWMFGTMAAPLSRPMLRYADYDGTGGVDYCSLFGMRQFTAGTLMCGGANATFLPGQ